MGRRAKPWYRKANDSWYVYAAGKQVLLCRGRANRKLAEQKFHEMMALAAAPEAGADNTVAVICETFLQHKERTVSPKTFANYRRTLQSFVDLHGGLTAGRLKKFHVEEWFRRHPTWGKSVEHVRKVILLCAFNHAEESGLIPRNPLRGLEMPPMRSRGAKSLVDPGDHEKLLKAAPAELRDVLVALRHTGCRPSEVCRVTAADFDARQGSWVLETHKTDKDGSRRVVMLTDDIVRLSKKLAQRHPTGPLFRNSRGQPWTSKQIANRVAELKKDLRLKGSPTAYGYRHTLATDLLVAGVPDTHVAALLGHKGTEMVHRHYAHVEQKMSVFRDELRRVVTPLESEKATARRVPKKASD
jgi:integrase